jgi:hypothetical protein
MYLKILILKTIKYIFLDMTIVKLLLKIVLLVPIKELALLAPMVNVQ